ncbi:MAG: Hsp20/alpha crystallin family protein [Anaerolineae bacterium]|nr:Hsp20/alpha crystallin family protein [Anaerolineae bacterium]
MADFDPRRELNSLRQSVERIIGQGVQAVQSLASGGLTLRLDIYEVGDHLVIRTTPIDGLVADSLEVSMDEGILTISGEARPEETPANASYLMQERRFGSFSRSVAISLPVRANEARARLRDGAIIITIPLDDAAREDDVGSE